MELNEKEVLVVDTKATYPDDAWSGMVEKGV